MRIPCLRSRYLKQIRRLQVVVKHQDRKIRELSIKHKDIDPLQFYYYKQRVKELKGVIDYYNDQDFMKKYREERNYSLQLEKQIEWLQSFYEKKVEDRIKGEVD